MKNLLTEIDAKIKTAAAEWERSKRSGGRPKGRRGANVSGDSFFLGVQAGLREARICILSFMRAAPVRSAAGVLLGGNNGR